MKKILMFMCLIFVCISVFTGCSNSSDSVVRIHIRANSNSTFDQEVKLKVRDDIVDFITPKIKDCENSDEVKLVLSENLQNIETIADKRLQEYGCNYLSSASIDNEYFPSRKYDDVTFPADYYDALIVRLGSGTGDNWWCVAYPPLCFVDDNSSDKVVYKSILVEIISKMFR